MILDEVAHDVAAQEKHEMFGAIFSFKEASWRSKKCTSAIKWRAAIDDLRELLHTLLQHLVGRFSRGLPRQRAQTRIASWRDSEEGLPRAAMVFPAASRASW